MTMTDAAAAQFRAKLRERGLCAACGSAPHSPGMATCERCRGAAAERRADVLAAGICEQCRKRPIAVERSRSRCEKCCASQRQRANVRNAAVRAAGKCSLCRTADRTVGLYCEPCWFRNVARRARVTYEDVMRLWERQSGACALSGQRLVPGAGLSLDMVVPLRRGGPRTIDNMRWTMAGMPTISHGAARACSVPGCDKPHKSRGLCHGHSERRRLGKVSDDPLLSSVGGRKKSWCLVPSCDRQHFAKGYCERHYQRWRKHGDPNTILVGPRGGGSIDGNGYRTVHVPDHPNALKSGRILEHRLVMAQSLGRPLLPNENVHHKNGDRTDNRLVKGHELRCPETCCNLELWCESQPSGQRVEDLLAWAKDIITRYGAG